MAREAGEDHNMAPEEAGSMIPDSPPAAKPNPMDDARLRLALETTLLAWVRTGMALMGFGFVVARFGLFLRELAAAGHMLTSHHHNPHASLFIGVALILIGVGVNVLAGLMNWRYLRRFPKGATDLPATMTLGMVLSLLVAVVGVAMAWYLSDIGV
jgi:putative membrane protein